jgi:hypothetical protein
MENPAKLIFDAGVSALDDRIALTNSLEPQALITMANLPMLVLSITRAPH